MKKENKNEEKIMRMKIRDEKRQNYVEDRRIKKTEGEN